MQPFKCGDQVYFRGYCHLLEDMEPRLHPGDLAVVAAVDRDGDALTCFPIDCWGRVISMQGDTLFPEEVLLLRYAGRVPRKRLPRPFGDMDNHIDDLPVGVDCRGPCPRPEQSSPLYTNAVYKARDKGGSK